MSKHETPLTRVYWQSIGGTLYEEFRAVEPLAGVRSRRDLDGLVVHDGPTRIAEPGERISLDGRDVLVIQTKSARLNVYLMGQALLSPELLKQRWTPRSIRSVILCTADDPVLSALIPSYETLELQIVAPHRHSGSRLMRSIPDAVDRVHHRVGGSLIAPAMITPRLRIDGLICPDGFSSADGALADRVNGTDVVLVHSTAASLGMYVGGEAIFAAELVRRMGAAGIRSVIACKRGDPAIEAAIRTYLDFELEAD
jgi:hypothetical protein